jgi:hypothetical protein
MDKRERGAALSRDERIARYNAMKALADGGASLADIAGQYDLSRARVQEILASGPPKDPGRPRSQPS